MISSAGVGSGLDVDSIVTQLMEIEQRPLLNISTQQLNLQAEISAIGQLKGAMSSLKTAVEALGSEDLFRSFNASSSDSDVIAASASATAAAGTHTIAVTQLAQAHRLGSVAFADADTTAVGTGSLTIGVGEDSFSLTIGSQNNTLNGIRDAINQASGNTGVTASILNVDGGSRLVLTANETGTANALTVTVSGDGDGDDADAAEGLSRLVYAPGAPPETPAVINMSQLDAALDAQFKVDTFDVTRSSNTVDDVIEGLTLTLKSEDTATVTVATSNAESVNAAQAVSDAFNTLRTTVVQLRGTELQGDSLLRGIESQLRNAFSVQALGPNAGLRTAFGAGFSFNDEGVMSFKSATLLSAVGDDIDSVISFFADEDAGFASRIGSLLGAYIDDNGVLEQRTDSLQAADSRLELRSTNIERQLQRTEDRIRSEFAALDILVANLEVTNNFLLQQLDSLPFTNLNRNR